MPITHTTDQPDVMTHTGPLLQARRARRSAETAAQQWVFEFTRHLSRALVGTCRVYDLGDIVDSEAVRVLERIDVVMSHWTPARYAAVRASGGRATIDHARREAAQRGEGARHERTVTQLDAPRFDDDPTTIAESITDGVEPSGTIVDRDLLQRALLGISADERRLVGLVHLVGLSVTEAANEIGIARETASRRLGRALGALETFIGTRADAQYNADLRRTGDVGRPAPRGVRRGWLHSV